ncbi:GSCOCG00005577001-RA-CDS [Cotesia congregata]|nr:GSCOCG00005577001-RA-CDS [Cotesia congregata]
MPLKFKTTILYSSLLLLKMKCHLCLLSFSTSSLLINHYKINHSINSKTIYKCIEEGCDRMYGNVLTFKKHLRLVHESKYNVTVPDDINKIESCHTEKKESNSLSSYATVIEKFDSENNAEVIKKTSSASQSLSYSNFASTNNNVQNFRNNIFSNKHFPNEKRESLQTNDKKTEANKTFNFNTESNRSATNKLTTDLTEFLSYLYTLKISRKDAVSIINKMNLFLSQSVFPYILQQVKDELNDENISRKFEIILKRMNFLEDFKSDERCLQFLEDNDAYNSPSEGVLGYAQLPEKANNDIIMVPKAITFEFISPTETLSYLFEKPDFYNLIMSYTNELNNETDALYNIMQAELWKSNASSRLGQIVLPLLVYFDGFDTGNVFGSHCGSNSIGGLYYTLACIPPQYRSQLNFIFIGQLIYDQDRKIFGNDATFGRIIEEFKQLRTKGINIQVNNMIKTIYFEVILITGDNLGLNGILGFVESFGVSKYYCRFCKMSRTTCEEQFVEDENLIRNKKQYDSDLIINNISLTGIKEKSVWNKLHNFHVTTNSAVDISHDMFEGVCIDTLKMILHHFIFKEQLFDVDTLNRRITLFDYGISEKSSKPPNITTDSTSEFKLKIKMSASEMTCFVRYLGLMIGDLVPRNHKVWDVWIQLRYIISMITSPVVYQSMIIKLKSWISKFLILQTQTFNWKIKPKAHFLTHYPRMMNLIGPLPHCSTIRWEAFHKRLKADAVSTSSKKNITHTICVKEQLRFKDFFKDTEYLNILNFGKKLKVTKTLNDYLSRTFSEAKSINIFSWIEIAGTKYCNGITVIIRLKTIDQLPLFGKIILVLEIDGVIYFQLKSLKSTTFDEHYFAYEISANESTDIRYIKYDSIPIKTPCLNIKKFSKQYVATRSIIPDLQIVKQS